MQNNAGNQISDLFIPGPNEFIPKNLDVEKREVKEVRIALDCRMISIGLTVLL